MSKSLEERSISTPIKDPIPSFIKKTYDLLEDEKIQDIVSWSEDGSCIVIKDPSEFSKKVLPLYFKHSKLTSFVRQLNMYNFHKRKTLNSYQVYYHELFQRDKKNLLNKIKRKATENSLEKSVHELEVLNSTRQEADITQENIILKKLNREALSKMYSLDSKLKELIDQNKYLWEEIYKKEKRQEMYSSVMKGIRGPNREDIPAYLIQNNNQDQKIIQTQPAISINPIWNQISKQFNSNPFRDIEIPLQILLTDTNTSQVLLKDPNQIPRPEISKSFDPISPEETYFDQDSFPDMGSSNLERDNQEIFLSEKESNRDRESIDSIIPIDNSIQPNIIRGPDADSEENY